MRHGHNIIIFSYEDEVRNGRRACPYAVKIALCRTEFPSLESEERTKARKVNFRRFSETHRIRPKQPLLCHLSLIKSSRECVYQLLAIGMRLQIKYKPAWGIAQFQLFEALYLPTASV